MAGKIFKFLPKAASFSIPNHSSNNKYMFSGPIVPMIPDHCRRKSNETLEEEEEESTSPKVSCMGQVRNHKKKTTTKTKKASLVKEEEEEEQQQQKKKKKLKKEAPKRTSSLGRLFWRKVRPARRGGVRSSSSSSGDEVVVVAPDVGRTRRYASRRETLKDFDRRTMTRTDVGDKAAEEALTPHSAAPVLVVGGAAVALEPKKEINIWMRRARGPPVPLQLN